MKLITSMEAGILSKNFNYRSFLPMILFIFGIYILFLLLTQKESQAIFVMMLSFVVFIGNNILTNVKGTPSIFNEYLEDLAIFFTFGISTIIFGFNFYKDNLLIIAIITFYSMTILLGMARSWILGMKNSIGWPLGLNGIFFPIFYYIYEFYLQGPGDSIFLFFYIIVGFLSVSHYNFLSSDSKILDEFMNPEEEKNGRIDKIIDDRELERDDYISKKEVKEVFLNKHRI